MAGPDARRQLSRKERHICTFTSCGRALLDVPAPRATQLHELTARSLGASPWQVFWRVVFPASLPHVVVGLRVALAAALSILVASELLGGDRGLDFVISDASTFFKTADVFVGIVLIGLIGLIADRALTFTARRIVHWEGKT